MQQSRSFPEAVEARLQRLLGRKRASLTGLSEELGPVFEHLERLLAGGKRLRARFCLEGLRLAAPDVQQQAREQASLQRAVEGVALALELFHAAALVHDDLIDRSETRRGEPAAHRAFAQRHAAAGWRGDAERFGLAAAVLLGDLLLVWSDEALDEALLTAPLERARAVRTRFAAMRDEVTAGQYLDVLAEQRGGNDPAALQLEAALLVARAKSARYSIAAPLLLGAELGGAGPELLETLERAGEAAGLAFQLRDDLLGALGDSAVTGKPSGDDLREGKRTVLIAEALAVLPLEEAAALDAALGEPDLDAPALARLQRSLIDSGAVEAVERRIAASEAEAMAALDGTGITEERLAGVRTLIAAASRRDA